MQEGINIEGFAAGPELERAVKQYKSHRRVSELES